MRNVCFFIRLSPFQFQLGPKHSGRACIRDFIIFIFCRADDFNMCPLCFDWY